MKGFEGNLELFAQSFQTYYNFIKNHMTLKVTPAQKADTNQKPEWKDLLLKALLQ
jgi:hypothetical protein